MSLLLETPSSVIESGVERGSKFALRAKKEAIEGCFNFPTGWMWVAAQSGLAPLQDSVVPQNICTTAESSLMDLGSP